MKKLTPVFAALFAGAAAMILTSCGSATTQPYGKFTGALLWKISGGGLDAPSHILGTHHILGSDTFDSIPGARAALEGSRQVVGELTVDDMAPLASQLQSDQMMPESESYKKLLSKADYAALDKGLKKLTGTGMEQMKAFKPGMITAFCTMAIVSKVYPDIHRETFVSMDGVVLNFAVERGLPMIGLDTVEDHIHALLDAVPLRFQAEQLVCGIRHTDYAIAAFKRQCADYTAGDLAAMYRNGYHDPDYPCPVPEERLNNEMQKGRNDKWLEKLPSIMAAAPSFIAVGAMHLTGEEGLLFQLDAMGYTVEAVK